MGSGSGSQVASYIFGGLFIGIWLYLLLFGVPADDGYLKSSAWGFWGFIGLILAGSIYGAQVASGAVRIALYVAIGITLAMLLMSLILREVEEGWATALTFVGAGLIVSALPRPNRPQ